MSFTGDQNFTVLLLSNSKLLKNKFISSLNNDQNQFSLMTKNIENTKPAEKISLDCLICDYVYDSEISESSQYVQVIDLNEKSVINHLISRSIELGSSKFKMFVNAIVFLFDETMTDTLTYVKSIHNEVKNALGSSLINLNLKFLLINMVNAIGASETAINGSSNN